MIRKGFKHKKNKHSCTVKDVTRSTSWGRISRSRRNDWEYMVWTKWPNEWSTTHWLNFLIQLISVRLWRWWRIRTVHVLAPKSSPKCPLRACSCLHSRHTFTRPLKGRGSVALHDKSNGRKLLAIACIGPRRATRKLVEISCYNFWYYFPFLALVA